MTTYVSLKFITDFLTKRNMLRKIYSVNQKYPIELWGSFFQCSTLWETRHIKQLKLKEKSRHKPV